MSSAEQLLPQVLHHRLCARPVGRRVRVLGRSALLGALLLDRDVALFLAPLQAHTPFDLTPTLLGNTTWSLQSKGLTAPLQP